MRFKKTLITVAVLAGAALYAWWPGFEPNLSVPVNLHLKSTPSFGADAGQGNIVGIEPVMEPLDYAAPDRFRSKLAGYFSAAKNKGWLGPQTIVLLPEHIGTGLLFVGAKSRSFSSQSATDAALPLITANLFGFFKNMAIFDEQNAAAAAFIRMRNRAASDAQFAACSALSRDFGVTIVAGSSVIMTPGAFPDSLSYGHGPIFNAAFVFGPDGKPIVDATRKLTLRPQETGTLTAGKARFLFPYEVAGRKIGVLIGGDAHSEEAITTLKNGGADLIVVPGFSSLDATDQAAKNQIPDLILQHGIQWAMKVNLKGALWGMRGHGQAWVVAGGTVQIPEAPDDGAAIYNLWLR